MFFPILNPTPSGSIIREPFLDLQIILIIFAVKNVKNENFDQGFRCAAPKRWSKYTTVQYNENISDMLFIKI